MPYSLSSYLCYAMKYLLTRNKTPTVVHKNTNCVQKASPMRFMQLGVMFYFRTPSGMSSLQKQAEYNNLYVI